MEKIGILGGSFNPIHTGHLLLADSARYEFELDRILFIPTGLNPFKKSNLEVDSVHRLKMVELAIESNPFFQVSAIEINQQGKTYTVDTIRKLQLQYPDASFYFITGADIMFEITRWREAESLLRSLTFVTSCRPGYSHKKLDKRIEELRMQFDTTILKLYSSEMDIASSTIRNRIKANKPIKYLLPESVEEYLIEHGLYKDERMVNNDD